jgi:hypothetical protein
MDQLALTIPVSGGQTLNLLSQRTDVSLINSSPLGRLISLASQLSHLYIEPLNLSIMVPLELTSVVTGLAKGTRHMPQATFYSIESPHHREHGAHGRVITVLPFCCSNL